MFMLSIEVYTKREKFVLVGSKIFPFRVDLISKVFGIQEIKQDTAKVASLLKGVEILPDV